MSDASNSPGHGRQRTPAGQRIPVGGSTPDGQGSASEAASIAADPRAARRQQIADAVVRVTSGEGLHAVTMRRVAEEAGISLRLVQYYFGTKEQLLLDTFQYLGEQFGQRVQRKLAGRAPTPRALLEILLEESLPTDVESRAFHLYYTSYAVLAMTRPDLTAPAVQGPNQMAQLLTGQLQAARDRGDMPAQLDPHAEAMGLLAMSAGLGSSVMAGQQSPREAAAILRYHLDRILPQPAPPPAETTSPQA